MPSSFYVWVCLKFIWSRLFVNVCWSWLFPKLNCVLPPAFNILDSCLTSLIKWWELAKWVAREQVFSRTIVRELKFPRCYLRAVSGVLHVHLLNLGKLIFIEHTQTCWRIDLFFKNNYRPATKKPMLWILSISSTIKYSMKMSTSPSNNSIT